MDKKQIEELRKRIYLISSSMFPLDSFFNDLLLINDDKYDKDMAFNDLKLIVDVIYDLINKAEEKKENEI